MRKAFAWILGIGAVVIVLLLAVLLWAGGTLKRNLQDSLNTQLQAMQQRLPTLSYEPFVCGGLRQIACESPRFALGGSVFTPLRLEVMQFSRERARIQIASDGLSLAGRELLSVLFGVVDSRADFSRLLSPSTLRCEVEGELADSMAVKIGGGVDLRASCEATAEALKYQLAWAMWLDSPALESKEAESKGGESKERESRGRESKEQEATRAGLDMILRTLTFARGGEGESLDVPLHFRTASLNLQGVSLPQAIISQIAGEVLERESLSYQAHYASLANAIQSAKNLALYVALLGQKSKSRELELAMEAVARMLLGQNAGVSFMMEATGGEGFALKEWLQDPVETLRKSGFTLQVVEEGESSQIQGARESS